MYKVPSVSGANLGPIGQCYPTIKQGNKQFTDRFIVLQYLCRNIILRLNLAKSL